MCNSVKRNVYFYKELYVVPILSFPLLRRGMILYSGGETVPREQISYSATYIFRTSSGSVSTSVFGNISHRYISNMVKQEKLLGGNRVSNQWFLNHRIFIEISCRRIILNCCVFWRENINSLIYLEKQHFKNMPIAQKF